MRNSAVRDFYLLLVFLLRPLLGPHSSRLGLHRRKASRSSCYCFPGNQKGLQCLKVTRDGQVIEPGDVVAEEYYVSTRHK